MNRTKKLNQKGYMLVEIVLASVLAMSIAYYLLDLTYNFNAKDEDLYYSILYTRDKNLITKNIMNDLDKGKLGENVERGQSDLTNESGEVIGTIEYIDLQLTLETPNEEETSEGAEPLNTATRRLMINREETGVTITYGKYADSDYDPEDVSYYQKKLEKSLSVGEITITEEEKICTILIPVQSLYNDETYDIKLLIQKDIQPEQSEE